MNQILSNQPEYLSCSQIWNQKKDNQHIKLFYFYIRNPNQQSISDSIKCGLNYEESKQRCASKKILRHLANESQQELVINIKKNNTFIFIKRNLQKIMIFLNTGKIAQQITQNQFLEYFLVALQFEISHFFLNEIERQQISMLFKNQMNPMRQSSEDIINFIYKEYYQYLEGIKKDQLRFIQWIISNQQQYFTIDNIAKILKQTKAVCTFIMDFLEVKIKIFKITIQHIQQILEYLRDKLQNSWQMQKSIIPWHRLPSVIIQKYKKQFTQGEYKQILDMRKVLLDIENKSMINYSSQILLRKKVQFQRLMLRKAELRLNALVNKIKMKAYGNNAKDQKNYNKIENNYDTNFGDYQQYYENEDISYDNCKSNNSKYNENNNDWNNNKSYQYEYQKDFQQSNSNNNNKQLKKYDQKSLQKVKKKRKHKKPKNNHKNQQYIKSNNQKKKTHNQFQIIYYQAVKLVQEFPTKESRKTRRKRRKKELRQKSQKQKQAFEQDLIQNKQYLTQDYQQSFESSSQQDHMNNIQNIKHHNNQNQQYSSKLKKKHSESTLKVKHELKSCSQTKTYQIQCGHKICISCLLNHYCLKTEDYEFNLNYKLHKVTCYICSKVLSESDCKHLNQIITSIWID